MGNAKRKRREKQADRKHLRATINSLTPVSLTQQLDIQGLSTQGNLNTLRNRLYRFSLYSTETNMALHDWNPAVDERPIDVLPFAIAGLNLQVLLVRWFFCVYKTNNLICVSVAGLRHKVDKKFLVGS